VVCCTNVPDAAAILKFGVYAPPPRLRLGQVTSFRAQPMAIATATNAAAAKGHESSSPPLPSFARGLEHEERRSHEERQSHL